MHQARIYIDEWAVSSRLHEVFDAKKTDFYPIVREVVGAMADASDNDPVFSAGMFGHIHGVRNTRAFFRSKGWNNVQKKGNSLVKHPERELLVAYQTVDLACSENENNFPKAISGKGDGAEAVINEAQLNLFPLNDFIIGQNERPINTGLWYLCVSVNGDDVRAEISLSRGIKNGNFDGFFERIFIIQKGEWGDLDILPIPDGGYPNDAAVDFEPTIKRK